MSIITKSYNHLAGCPLFPWYTIDIEYDTEDDSKTVVFRSRIHLIKAKRTTFEWSGSHFSDIAILFDPTLTDWVISSFGVTTQEVTL